MLKKIITSSLCLIAANMFCAQAKESFEPTWESLSRHEAAPDWFKNAKFGIYLHWGVYSVPEFQTEWYPRYLYFPWSDVAKHHEATYGPVSEFGYHDLIPLFTAEDFDASEWAALFKEAGARFAGLVAEHHDGFAMWDSEHTPWNAADMGPKKDVVGLLGNAIKGNGMKFITTFHHARNLQRYSDPEKLKKEMARDFGTSERRRFWQSHFPYYEGTDPATTDPKLRYLYGNVPAEQWYREIWLPELVEVIDNYDPDIIYFDSWLDLIPEDYRQRFCAYYLNKAEGRGKDVVILSKQEDLPLSVSVENFENSRKQDLDPNVWQTEQTVSYDSWSYTKGFKIKPASHLVHEMIDVVSKNGVFLLNISPRASGLIPDDQKLLLREIGEWLRKYGEAIYDTRPWYTYGEGPTLQPEGDIKNRQLFDKLKYTKDDYRFTTKGDAVYVITLSEPEAGSDITIASFAPSKSAEKRPIKSVTMLGSDARVEWNLGADGLKLKVPAEDYNISTVFKVEYKAI